MSTRCMYLCTKEKRLCYVYMIHDGGYDAIVTKRSAHVLVGAL
jgi:hypothetical protein